MDVEADRSSAGVPVFIRSYLAAFRPLLQHRAARGYRNARFMRYVFKQRAVSQICDLVAPAGFYVVAYGDWKAASNSPISRRWAGPQQEIKHELQRRGNVLFRNMWEYRTSVTCSSTWRRLSNMRAHGTQFDRESWEMATSARYVKVHKALHCRSSAGALWRRRGGTWNRDANASRNILMLLMLEVLGAERPKELMPADSGKRRVRRQG